MKSIDRVNKAPVICKIAGLPDGRLAAKEVVRSGPSKRGVAPRVGTARFQIEYGPCDEAGFAAFRDSTMVPALRIFQAQQPVAVQVGKQKFKGLVFEYADDFRGWEGLYVTVKVAATGAPKRVKGSQHDRRPNARHRSPSHPVRSRKHRA